MNLHKQLTLIFWYLRSLGQSTAQIMVYRANNGWNFKRTTFSAKCTFSGQSDLVKTMAHYALGTGKYSIQQERDGESKLPVLAVSILFQSYCVCYIK